MTRVMMMVLAVALAVTACGRKGPLKRVDGAAASQPAEEDRQEPAATLF